VLLKLVVTESGSCVSVLQGDIYKASYSGWYCVDCEEYKDEKEMDEEHNCPTHRKPCQHREEVGDPPEGLQQQEEIAVLVVQDKQGLCAFSAGQALRSFLSNLTVALPLYCSAGR
jgi:methionyl-tRNA synthetase